MDFSVQISDLGLAATEHAEYKVSPLLVSSAWLSSVKTGVSRLLSQKGHTSSYIEERKHTQTTHNMQCLGWLTLEVFFDKVILPVKPSLLQYIKPNQSYHGNFMSSGLLLEACDE